MKKITLLLALLCLPLLSFAQTNEQQYYIYNIVTFTGSLDNEGIRVNIDDGKTIDKLRDSNGERMKFNTPAAAFMYLISQGWEFYLNGATSEGAIYDGYGASITTSYWIIRKPCTKEDFNTAVSEGILKEIPKPERKKIIVGGSDDDIPQNEPEEKEEEHYPILD